MTHQVHEAANGVVANRIVGNSRAIQCINDRLIHTDPGCENRLGPVSMLLAIAVHPLSDGCGDIASWSNRALDMHHQYRVVVFIGQQDFKRSRITASVGIADDIDGVRYRRAGRKQGTQLSPGGRSYGCWQSAELNESIKCKSPDATPIGENRQT